MFTCELENVLECQAAWARATHSVALGSIDGVEKGIREAVDDTRAHHSFRSQSGALERSISGELTGVSPNGAEGIVRATVKYASYVEEGTRPHVIRPKADAGAMGPLNEGQSRLSRKEMTALKRRNRAAGAGYVRGAPVLSWVGEQGRVYARIVHHPGTKAMPFLGPAYFKLERVIVREVEASAPRAQAAIDRG